jgi:hypothetical protein
VIDERWHSADPSARRAPSAARRGLERIDPKSLASKQLRPVRRTVPWPGTRVATTRRVLRISRHDADTGRALLILEGRFVAAWAEVLERECAEAGRSGLPVALDLSEVRDVSRAGLEALARLCRGGVAIEACPPLIAEMLEQEGIDLGEKR